MIEYRVGDVRDRLAEIPDGSIDLIVTSPPFLALRSYLPADHPDKHKEIGSEATPADFLDTLLALTAEFGRVLAPHGSICVELGDTYAGDDRRRTETVDAKVAHRINGRAGSTRANVGRGWPLAKSLTGIPTLYPWSLAYNRNLLTGQESPAGQWRIRNIIVWARPNPPVGALGDKFRPATSYITVACRGARRYFDLDAVRTPLLHPDKTATTATAGHGRTQDTLGAYGPGSSAGAPPLDWHTDQHPEDGDWLWKLATAPYKGSHYATFPLTLPKRLIEAMCPQRACVECGQPSTRIAEVGERVNVCGRVDQGIWDPELSKKIDEDHPGSRWDHLVRDGFVPGHAYMRTTVGWSDCGHDAWRTGVVLDPFAGSGTTLEAAQIVGRHAIGIDLDQRNATLARERVGMFMEVTEDAWTEANSTNATILEVRSEGGR